MLYLVLIFLSAVLIYLLPKHLKMTKEFSSLSTNFSSEVAKYKETELNKQMGEYHELVKIEVEKRMKDNEQTSTRQALEMVAKWKIEYEEATRQDAINKSQAIMMGKTLEHLIPFFPEFKWNPRDARFLGSPVDLIVFDGLSEGKLRQIVFVEIKTNTSQLNAREIQIHDIIKNGKVKWEELRHMISGIVKP